MALQCYHATDKTASTSGRLSIYPVLLINSNRNSAHQFVFRHTFPHGHHSARNATYYIRFAETVTMQQTAGLSANTHTLGDEQIFNRLEGTPLESGCL